LMIFSTVPGRVVLGFSVIRTPKTPKTGPRLDCDRGDYRESAASRGRDCGGTADGNFPASVSSVFAAMIVETPPIYFSRTPDLGRVATSGSLRSDRVENKP
jgi:hypothetical protein